MSLDLEADDFDPVAALASTNITLPCPDVQPLSNLAAYANATAQVARSYKQTASTSKKVQRVNVFKESPPRRRLKNVLTIMEDIQGPMARLRDCMKDHTTVKVWIRRAVEMRGVCTGYILAFDHHWNLIMSDVDETYVLKMKKIKTVPNCESSVSAVLQTLDSGSSNTDSEEKLNLQACETRQKQKTGACDKASKDFSFQKKKSTEATGFVKKPKSAKLELKKRHVHQLFIRGDSVAFISIP